MNLRPYSKYKDSGVPWLGQVPKDWVNYPGLAVLKEKQVRNTGLKEKTVLSLSYGKIKVKSLEKMHGLVPESFETYQIVEPGDIIIRATDLQNDKTSLRTGKVKDKGIITSAYLRLKPQPAFDKDYAHALLHGLDLVKVFYGMGSGLRQNLSWIDFKRMPFFLPPLPEQNQIARYLDWKTVQIAKFIKDKKRMIELLKEQKQVIINDAVTGKIDVTTGKPYHKYKDSGVEWLGQVPDGWTMFPLKTACIIQTGITLGKIYNTNYTKRYPYLRVANVQAGYLNLFNVKSIEVLSVEAERSMLRSGDVLMTEGGDPDKLGRGCVWNSEIDPCLHQNHIFAVRPNRNLLLPSFLSKILSSEYSKEYFLRTSKQTTNLASTNKTTIGKFRIPIPTIEQQEYILHALSKRFSSLDLVISRTEREIGLMQEYRDRLIADVVTGKLDVRGIAVPEELEELPAEDADEEPDEMENDEEEEA